MIKKSLIQLPLVFTIVLSCSLFTPASAKAQNAGLQVRSEVQTSLKGLSVADISKRFGPPDKQRSPASGRESWTYGESLIFFTKGKVTAWSDSGELAARKNLAAIKTSDSEDIETFTLAWQNAWTPNQTITVQEALQDLLNSCPDDPENQNSLYCE